jgi:hypothetical protein
MQITNFSQLSRGRQVLTRMCQRVNYGSILNVQVIDSDPCFDVLPEVSIDVRLDIDVCQRRELGLADFALPVEIFRLLAQIDALKNGCIEKIVVHDGIPRRLIFRGSLPEVFI